MSQGRQVRGEHVHDLQQAQQYPLRSEQKGDVSSHLPLSTLLSQVLVAFTIEFDNEFEHQMPHRTTNYGSTTGSRQAPWLVSLAMWSNCIQFVDEGGVTVGELQRLARTETNLAGMQRGGYIIIEPDLTGTKRKQLRPDAMIRLTPGGRKAQEVGRPLFDVIEKRWQSRFGTVVILNLRASLERLVSIPSTQQSPLFKGLEPYPDGWRASVRKPDTLPHYPMVLHRGGFPDGS